MDGERARGRHAHGLARILEEAPAAGDPVLAPGGGEAGERAGDDRRVLVQQDEGGDELLAAAADQGVQRPERDERVVVREVLDERRSALRVVVLGAGGRAHVVARHGAP